MNRQQLDRLITNVNEALEETGLYCLEAEWVQSENVLRVFIDRSADGVVDLADCGRANERLIDLDYINEVLPDEAELEVSSPGANRPLRSIEDFAAATGEEIEVRLGQKTNGRVYAKGRVLAVSEKEVKLETSRGEWGFSVDDLLRASILYDWNSVSNRKILNEGDDID